MPAGFDAAIGLQRIDGGVAVHVLRYAYDEAADGVPVLPDLELRVRLPGVSRVSQTAPADVSAAIVSEDTFHALRLTDVPLYSVIVLS